MEFSARVTLAPYETKVGSWMPWPTTEPTVFKVTTLASGQFGEFECAIDERASETIACTRYVSRHTTAPATTWARVEMPQGRDFRLRFTSYALAGIQFDIGLRGTAMP